MDGRNAHSLAVPHCHTASQPASGAVVKNATNKFDFEWVKVPELCWFNLLYEMVYFPFRSSFVQRENGCFVVKND